MKKSLTLLLAVFSLSLVSRPANAIITNRVAAIVGNQVITSMSVRQAISVEYRQDDFNVLAQNKQDEIRNKTLEVLIDELLISLKATSMGISVSEDSVDETIDRVLKQNHMDQEMLEKALVNQGLTFTSYHNKIASDLLKAKFVSKVVKANIIITNQEVLTYAKKHNLFKSEESVTLAQIFIPNSSTNAAAGEQSEVWKNVRNKLKNEENFFALASKYSEGPSATKGGRLGTFERGHLLTEIEDVAYELPLGKASNVIKSSLGYHMIMVSNRTGGEDEHSLTPDTEEQIKTKLYDEKLEQAAQELSKNLRREFNVKIIQ
ncbi:peptidylprolyl isomerase [bacterium]|nr:peptidylprolyl isomerase [bacterium]